MADTFTEFLNLTLPEIGASDDTWGDKINDNLDILDALLGPSGEGTVVTRDASDDALVSGINLTKAAGNNRLIKFKSGTALRWDAGASNEAEAGSSAGSRFYFNRYNDAGAYLGTPIIINRDTGVLTLETTPKVGANTIWHAGNDGAASALDADLLDGQHGAFYAPIASPSFTGTAAFAADVSIGDDLTVIGDAAVGGNATVTGTLGVTGNGTFAADVSIGDDLAVSGDATIAGTLGVTGQLTANAAGGVVARNTIKAFGCFKGGTLQSGSFGVSGITSNGNDRRVTLSTTLANDDYCVHVTEGSGQTVGWSLGYHNQSTTTFDVRKVNTTTNGTTPFNDFSFMVLSNE